MKKSSVLIALIICLSACSAAKPKVIVETVSDDFQVEVTSDGRPVKNLNQRLVHHFSVSPAAVNALRTSFDERRKLPFPAEVVRDLRGGVSGARLLAPNSRLLETLGLQPEDLVTAVNRQRIRSLEDVALLFSSLDEANVATVTLLRGGLPHKLLYRVGDEE